MSSTQIAPELKREFRSWQGKQFYGSRIEIIRQRLNTVNRVRFEALDYDQQCLIVAKFIHSGAII